MELFVFVASDSRIGKKVETRHKFLIAENVFARKHMISINKTYRILQKNCRRRYENLEKSKNFNSENKSFFRILFTCLRVSFFYMCYNYAMKAVLYIRLFPKHAAETPDNIF